jgi:hypothetical protein
MGLRREVPVSGDGTDRRPLGIRPAELDVIRHEPRTVPRSEGTTACVTNLSRARERGPRTPGVRIFFLPLATEEWTTVTELDDAPPPQLVQALGALLHSTDSSMERHAIRAAARTAVTTFVRRRRAQGERADHVLTVVRSAWRRALQLHEGTVDRLAEPWRALREEIVRWAMRADTPDALPPREYTPRPEASPNL